MNLIEDYYKLPFEDRDYFLITIEFEEIEEKWYLFLDILDNPDFSDPNYDLVAIRVLKILEIAKVPNTLEESFINVFSKIIKTSSDDDIRNYVIIASKKFIEHKDLQETIIDFLNTETENPILKYNALNALGQIKTLTERREILKIFEKDKDIGKYVSGYIQ
jgi:hypothetical protein